MKFTKEIKQDGWMPVLVKFTGEFNIPTKKCFEALDEMRDDNSHDVNKKCELDCKKIECPFLFEDNSKVFQCLFGRNAFVAGCFLHNSNVLEDVHSFGEYGGG